MKVTIVGLVDDDPGHAGHVAPPLSGPRAGRRCAVRLAEEHEVDEFFIAIPSADSRQMERIYAALKDAHLPIKTLPPLAETHRRSE